MKRNLIMFVSWVKNHLALVILGLIILLLLYIFYDVINDWNWTAIGVLVALFLGIVQLLIANKNMSDDIQIRRAEFTNQFIKEFQKLMPELNFCAYVYKKFSYESESSVKELHKKLLDIDKFDFSIAEYNDVKRELSIDDKMIETCKIKFQGDLDKIIKIAADHYRENGLSDFCSFHKSQNQYNENMRMIEEKYKGAISKSEKNEKKKEISGLKKVYVNSIFVNMQNVVNELECNTLSVQFDLLDYDKITNLIYVPLHYYISNLYIIMMENKIDHEKHNYFIYSNIKRFCSEIVKIKNKINIDMATQNFKSEKKREKLIANAANVKKL